MSNWGPAVIAAILVGGLGTGAGIVIGGGDDGETRTETVVQQRGSEERSTETEADAGGDSTTERTTTDDSETAGGEEGTEPVAEAFSAEELTSNTGNAARRCIARGGGAAIRGIGGEPLTDPAIFKVLYSNRTYCGPWRIALPVSEYDRFEIGRLGWADNAPEGVETRLTIHADTLGSEPLFDETFDGPAAVVEDVSLELGDAERLIIEWRPGPELFDTTDDFAYAFILDEAYVS